MIRSLLSGLLGLAASAPCASAHFTFVVPQPGDTRANVIMSEDLKPDGDVDVAIIAGARLTARDVSGHETALTAERAADSLLVKLPRDTRLVYGVVDLGVHERKNSEPHLLIYHPKTVVGDAFEGRAAVVGAGTPIEIFVDGKSGAVTFRVEIAGKPAAGVEVHLILPDGTQKTIATGQDGRTQPLQATGRYGAWAKVIQSVGGERDGKKFTQARHYATLVADVSAPAKALTSTTRPVERFLSLPQATSSFGGVAVDGWLYIYGGHIAPTHQYHTGAVSGRFHRLNLSDPKAWEELPAGPALQGMNLATHKGKVYRIGGMAPRNGPGEKADNFSMTACARFDPETQKWEELPPLPEPRSSHDVIVIGERLYVVGGWNLRGKGKRPAWPDNALVMDLASASPAWRSIPQPFQRRALIGAAHDGKVIVLGGFDENDDPIRRVDIFDPKANAWTAAPSLPGRQQNGFAPAACTHDGSLYVSVGDGGLYRLGQEGKAWELVAKATPRIAHRMVANGQSILIIGGAAKGDNMDLVESVTPEPSSRASAN